MTLTTGVDERSPSLTETLQAAADGQGWARESLSGICLPELTAFAEARGAIDPGGIANTVMVEFLARLDTLDFDTAGHMWAYLYRIARSRIIDERRRTKPVEFHDQHAFDQLLPPVTGPDDQITDQHYVDGLLSSLTTDQRQILEMRFLDDLTIEETANRTGRTLTAVKGLQRRAIRALLASAFVAIVVAVIALAAVSGNDASPIVSENPASEVPSDRPADEADEADEELGQDSDALLVTTEEGAYSESAIVSGPVILDTVITNAMVAADDPSTITFSFEAVVEEPPPNGLDGDNNADTDESAVSEPDDGASVDAETPTGINFECRLEGAEWAPCASPLTVSDLIAGSHLFEVRLSDADGVTDPTPASHVWVVERPADRPTGPDLEAMRASPEVLRCGGESGTWAELTEQGWDVMVGTPNDDVIDVSTGDRPDLVISGGGNDTITTGPGDDIICSGSGNDTVSSGGGDDRISTAAGNDTINAGPNNDRVWAGPGNDSLHGGAGNDQLRGQGDVDVIDGGANNDILEGGDDLDQLIGGAGRDECHPGIRPPTTTDAAAPAPDPGTTPEPTQDEESAHPTCEPLTDTTG